MFFGALSSMLSSLKLCKKVPAIALMDPSIKATMSGEHHSQAQQLRDKKVKDLITAKRSLVEVSCTATLAETMNQLVSNRVLAVPIAAPPGHWIGAGGSMIMECDKQSGATKKQYIGIVTMLDILAHIAAADGEGGLMSDLDRKMAAPVTSVIGHCLEGLSLWTLNPNTGILDCMEVFSKGIHRALVPLESSHMDMGERTPVVSAAELVESAPSYQLVSQMDVVRFLRDHNHTIEMQGIVSRSVQDLRAINRTVYAITDQTKLVDAIKCMRGAMINAVPIVAASEDLEDHSRLLQVTPQERKKLVGTLSATDLRGCHLATLQTWLSASALHFTEKLSRSPLAIEGARPKDLVTCTDNSSLSEVMCKAVDEHVHRIWVVDNEGLLCGVVSLTDIIRVLRIALLSAQALRIG